MCLGKGSRLFLYTDGVTEAMDVSGQMFTKERLEKKMSLLSVKAEPGEVIEDVLLEIQRHAGAAEQSDDITMVALNYAGKGIVT
jgi:sigma-B regulation protein RsbU (phosphoserine phosphatase)